MVAMADRAHYTQPPTCVAYHRTTAMTQTMSPLTKSQRWGSPLTLRPRVGCSFTSQKGVREQTFVPPSAQPFLASRVLPSSKVMSSQIIQSFRNRLLFARPPFGGLFAQQTATVAIETLWLPCQASGMYMLAFPEGNLNNESVFAWSSHCNWSGYTTQQPHQRKDNTVCDNKECDAARPVNNITSDDIAQETQSPASTAELFAEEDADLSDFEPSHSEYESDDDDSVKFSDESLPPPAVQTLAPQCAKYVTLVSSESGYFECTPGCDQLETEEGSDDCWSDSESDGEIEFCSEVWDSFEIQALSPMVLCTRTKTHSSTEEASHVRTQEGTSAACQTPISESHPRPNKEEAEDQRQTDYITVHNPKKHVSFKPDAELAEVHTIVAWEYAYRAARKGPWEQFARDRCRFRRRIDSVSAVLEPCLSDKLARMSTYRES